MHKAFENPGMGEKQKFAGHKGSQDMNNAECMLEVWRGPFLESVHFGHAVICDGTGEIIEAWGDCQTIILPRSSCKMIQALPLVEGGYADDLSTKRLALACASHQGAAVHRLEVASWLAEMDLTDDALRCGPQMPRDRDERRRVICDDHAPLRLHNNCSGKHAGFLMLAQSIGGGSEYHDPNHPVQQTIRQCFEDLTGSSSPGFAIDGCSAPNFATSISNLAAAMGRFARGGHDRRGQAMTRLTHAMMAEPVMVAGKGRACTELMEALEGHAAVKTGAEGVFVAICPELDRGLAVKIADGATRAAEAVITALLVRVGALDAAHPTAQKYLHGPIRNWDGFETGYYRVTPALLSAHPSGKAL